MYAFKLALSLVLLPIAEGTPFEDVKYDQFIGKWYSCLETTHMTFAGEAQKKHTHQNEKCRAIEMANIEYVGDENGMDADGVVEITQILELQHTGLNHCEFWGFTGATCPNATWSTNDRGAEGTIMYHQNFHGIGSFGSTNHVKFYGEEKHAIDINGDEVHHPFDHMEDQDFFDCSYKEDLQGIVCDTRQNEYRNAGDMSNEEGWTSAYADFGSYYLVQDMSKCGFCEEYKCKDSKKKMKANIMGLGNNNKVTCSNVGKVEEEVTKQMICDTEAEIVGGSNGEKGLIKDHCPNVCGMCMDMV